MSPTYLFGISTLIFNFLDLLGIKVVQTDLQTTVVTIYTIVAALIIAIRRFKHGGINLFGKKA